MILSYTRIFLPSKALDSRTRRLEYIGRAPLDFDQDFETSIFNLKKYFRHFNKIK